MSRTIIVSDLHIDTWDGREIGKTGKKKHEHFLEFLDRCERAGIREFADFGDVDRLFRRMPSRRFGDADHLIGAQRRWLPLC